MHRWPYERISDDKVRSSKDVSNDITQLYVRMKIY